MSSVPEKHPALCQQPWASPSCLSAVWPCPFPVIPAPLASGPAFLLSQAGNVLFHGGRDA